jgi:hypothetical protein
MERILVFRCAVFVAHRGRVVKEQVPFGMLRAGDNARSGIAEGASNFSKKMGKPLTISYWLLAEDWNTEHAERAEGPEAEAGCHGWSTDRLLAGAAFWNHESDKSGESGGVLRRAFVRFG